MFLFLQEIYMSAYVVDPLAYARASSLVLVDRRPRTDALFIHGSPAADDEIDLALLKLGASMVDGGESGVLVINGLSDEACWPNGQRLAYPGSDTWGKALSSIGCPDFLKIPPSEHTAVESDNVIKMAEERGWKSVTIMSYPHHILRCMMQMVFCLTRAKSKLGVFTRTLPTVHWQKVAEKGVLRSAPFRGTLVDAHVREEYERLIKYADKEGTGYTPHATLEELIAYYARRDEA